MANSKLSVLIAAGIYPPDPGGPALHAQKQFEWFRSQGLEVRLVVLFHYRKWPMGLRHFFYFLKIVRNIFKCDIVYAHDAIGAGIPALLAARIFRKKFIVRVGGDVAWERKAESGQTNLSMNEWYKEGKNLNDVYYRLSRWLLWQADKIVVTSQLLSDLYEKYYGVSPEKVVVVVNPVPEIRENVITSKGDTIVYASRLVAYKNLEFVLRVLSKIFKSNKDLKFIIMGDGPERKNLEDLSKALGIKESVVFKGSVSQSSVMNETANCLFAIAPALTEFNPNYILQAISFSKPFLVNKENGFSFEVPNDFTFDPRNEQELEQRILNLIDERGYTKAQELAKNINFKMTWNEVLNANLDLVKSITKD
ncbi:MAG: glycosyltransferase family 4 protein [Minisyncoccota bacterium]